MIQLTALPPTTREATIEASAGLTGLQLLEAVRDGSIPPPPFAVMLGLDLDDVSEGRAVFGLQADERFTNPLGTVHGGVTTTVLDSAMACAVHSTLPAGVGYTTVELKVNFVRAVRPGTGRLVAIGEVVHRGRQIVTAEARMYDDRERLIAHATSTCLVLGPSD